MFHRGIYRTHRTLLLAGVALLGAAWGALTGVWFVWPSSDRPMAADAVMVLAGGRGERLEAALELMDAGTAPVLLISNGRAVEWPQANRVCERERHYEVLCPSPDPQTTIGEARMLRALADDRGWQSAVIVTSTYHSQRAKLQLSSCFDGAIRVVTVEPRQPWWRTWFLAAREQVGYLDALIRSRAC